MKPAASAELPWLIFDATNYLDLLLAGMIAPTVLETGEGGSTVFFAERCKRLISFEHNGEWAATVAGNLRVRKLSNVVEQRFRPDYPVTGLLRDPDNLPDIDIAFIDGRGRVRSVIDAVKFIKPGGWLILDDSDRSHYAEARRIGDFASELKIIFRSGPDETTFWRIKQ